MVQGLSGELVNVLREAKQVVPEALLKFGTHVKKKVSPTLHFFYFFVYTMFVRLLSLITMYLWHAVPLAT